MQWRTKSLDIPASEPESPIPVLMYYDGDPDSGVNGYFVGYRVEYPKGISYEDGDESTAGPAMSEYWFDAIDGNYATDVPPAKWCPIS